MRLCLERGVQANKTGVTDVDEAIKSFFDKGGKVKFSKEFKDKNYTELDLTSLFEIIPKVTQITPDNPDVNLHILYKSLQEIKNIRNQTMHVIKGTTSENKMPCISEKLEKIVDQLRKCFNIEFNEIGSFKNKIQRTIDDIENPRQAREKELKEAIKKSTIRNNREQWAPMIMKSMESDILPFSDKPMKTSDIFHETDFEVLSDHNISRIHDHQDDNNKKPDDRQDNNISEPHTDRQTISCADILSSENSPSIYIIEGDPGSGKSTYLRMMCLEFCKNSPDSTFKLISSYDMMMLINCRDREKIDNIWQYLCETHYEETARNFQNKEAVMSAMKEMKIIIAIDGLDEANVSTTALVRDVIHHFGGSKTVRFLITTRPGFSKNVVEQFDKRAIQYRVVNIKPIETSNAQEKFIRRVVRNIPEINIDAIVITFRAKREAFISHFVRPLGLILFIELFQKFPDKIEKLTNGQSLMDLSYELHTQNMAKRMPDIISNAPQCSRAVLKLFGRKSLKLIQNNSYEIDQKILKSLEDECFKLDQNIPVESVISCVLIKRKYTKKTMTEIHDFSHHSQQEYLGSKVLSEKLTQEYFASKAILFKNKKTYVEKTTGNLVPAGSGDWKIEPDEAHNGDLLKVLQELTGEQVEKNDMARLVLE